MPVIYQQYRPKTFADVIGQEHIKTTLAREIIDQHLAHAYLFVGPRGTGKTTLARLIARSINCEKRQADSPEPCNTCSSCTQILKDQFLDLIEIDAATHTQVDNVRDNIIANSRVPALRPNGYKIFIIDEVHMLSKHAFNALLKTIEEPPARVMFILATTDVHKVPGTIISRCERHDFKKIPQKLIIEKLTYIASKEKIKVPTTIIQAIAKKSEGCLRDAESLFGQVLSLAEDGVVELNAAELVIAPSNWVLVDRLLNHLAAHALPESLTYVHELVQEGVDLELFMTDMLEYLRQVLMLQSIGKTYVPDIDENTDAAARAVASKLSSEDVRRLLDIFMRETLRMKSAVIQQLPLELACVAFCQDQLPSMTPQTPTPQPQSAQQSGSVQPDQMINDYQVLRKEWGHILSSLKGYNHSLAVFLKTAHPLSIDESMVKLGFKYDFHANTVRESRNRTLAEEAFSKVLRRTVHIDGVVDPQYTENHKIFNGGAEPEVADVLDIMGGEIV